MSPKTAYPLARFGLVPAIVIGALLLRWPLWPILGDALPLLFLWPAVVLCAGLWGLWPGLLATVLAAVAGGTFFWMAQETINILEPGVWVGLLLFVALGGLTSLGLERWHEAQREGREACRKLAAERDWLRAFLTAMAGGVIVTDEEERVTFINPAAGALTGWSPEEALGKHVNAVFHIISEKTRQTIEKPVARVLREGKPTGPTTPTLLVARDGAEKRADAWIAPVRSVGSGIIGAVVSFDEVSHRGPRLRASLPAALTLSEPAALADVPSGAQRVAVQLRILIVEDNRDSAEGLATLLTLQGHEVAIAYSGHEALRRATEWQPQLVLCDIGLPGMDGNSVASALRKDPTTARARLIALTGNSSEEERQRCLAAGFDHHLTKPVEPQVLQNVIALQTLVSGNENLTGRRG